MPEDLPHDVRLFLADYIYRRAEALTYNFYSIDQKNRFADGLLRDLGVT